MPYMDHIFGCPKAIIECDKYLANSNLRLEDCTRHAHTVSFFVTIPSGQSRAAPLEIRVWTAGLMRLVISSIAVERIG